MKSYSRAREGSRYFSSDSNFSSESDVDSSCDSDGSSDDFGLRLNGTKEEKKFKRLRRIFLNRPVRTTKKENNQRSKNSLRRHNSPRRSSRSSVADRRCSCRGDTCSRSSSSAADGAMDTLNKPLRDRGTRPLQAAITQHMNALQEQMKRHSAQRDSTANQVESILEQAVEELQFLQKQEERALENQVRIIRETYALRLEVFQQQYLNKVAEIEDEMYTSIQRRQEQCDSTILTAAKKLQDQTQRALVKDLAIATGEPAEEQLDSSISTDSSSASQPKAQRQRAAHHEPLQLARVAPMVQQVSPVSQQRAKLHALEEKLAAFSPESLNRVKSELATPVRRSKVEGIPPRNERESVSSHSLSIGFNDSHHEQNARDADEWRASPLSPLRSGPSYWRNGISLEADNNKSTKSDGMPSSKFSRRQSPASRLSRRYLRPEEEEELRHLRTSIGLAKDWMARHSQT